MSIVVPFQVGRATIFVVEASGAVSDIGNPATYVWVIGWLVWVMKKK